jgi:hypothetical protein
MAATITWSTTPPPLYDSTQSTAILRGSIAFTGTYPTGGDTLNFTTHATGVINYNVSNHRPIRVIFWEEPASGTTPSGLVFYYRNTNAKPTGANGVVQILGAGTVSGGTATQGVELGNATYPTMLTGTTLKFEAVFPLGI